MAFSPVEVEEQDQNLVLNVSNVMPFMNPGHQGHPGTAQVWAPGLESRLGITECGWGWRWAVPFWSLPEQEGVCCPGHTQNPRYALPHRSFISGTSLRSQHRSPWDLAEPLSQPHPDQGAERLLWAEDAS